MFDTIPTQCPHPGCQGEIKIATHTEEGEYACICKAVKLRLTWATYAGKGRVPFLRVVEQPAEVKES